MYFYNKIKEISKNEKIIIYVDMDGVIASYNFGLPLDFKNKRPLQNNIKVLEKISKLDNVELNVLSICKKDFQIKDKNDWLDKYAPFFNNKRIIISKESNSNIESKDLKLNYLKSLDYTVKTILIDDDNEILKHIRNNLKEIILFQDSELID